MSAWKMTTNEAPAAKTNACVRPSFKPTFAAVMLMSPGGVIPTDEVRNPKNNGSANPMLFYFKPNIRNCLVNFQILLLVKCLNFSHFGRGALVSVNIVVRIQNLVAFAVEQPERVAVHEFAVGLEVDHAAWLEDFFVQLQEFGIRHAVFGALVFDLRIGKRDPDLVDFACTEQIVDELDLRAQETDVFHPGFFRSFGPAPETRALDVDSDEVLVRESFGQTDGILAFAATQFQNERLVVLEKILVPFAFEREIARGHFLPCRLHHIRKRLVFLKPF